MPGKPITRAATVTAPEVAKLLKVGFSVDQVRFIAGSRDATQQKAFRVRSRFSKAQVLVLTTGTKTMKTLLLAKFTRAQAKVLLEVFAA